MAIESHDRVKQAGVWILTIIYVIGGIAITSKEFCTPYAYWQGTNANNCFVGIKPPSISDCFGISVFDWLDRSTMIVRYTILDNAAEIIPTGDKSVIWVYCEADSSESILFFAVDKSVIDGEWRADYSQIWHRNFGCQHLG